MKQTITETEKTVAFEYFVTFQEASDRARHLAVSHRKTYQVCKDEDEGGWCGKIRLHQRINERKRKQKTEEFDSK